MKWTRCWLAFAVLMLGVPVGAFSQSENRVDRIRPDAPELAAYGELGVGVRSVELVHKDQVDIVNVKKGDSELPRYDRPLPVEVWYPTAAAGAATPYEVFLRDGKTEVQLVGRSIRDAEPKAKEGGYPLVLVSHGYPGNRFLMSPLAENLASKGYVVVSIDHTDSTYRTAAAFGSTLVNRPLDQLFVLNEIDRMSSAPGGFLSGLADADKTALVGYSMGGYGAVITSGGGVTQAAVDSPQGAPAGTLARHLAGSKEHEALMDERIRAVVSFAPWGMTAGMWDAEGLAGIRIPTLFIAGSADDVSGYEKGVRKIYELATGAERHLLTFEGANHNAAAPMPAPQEVLTGEGAEMFSHYGDAVWDTARMNNIAQHFVTAYLGVRLKGDSPLAEYLDLVPVAEDGVWGSGRDDEIHTYWKGFSNRTAVGLRLELLEKGEEAGR